MTDSDLPPPLPDSPNHEDSATKKSIKDKFNEFTQSKLLRPLRGKFQDGMQWAKDPSKLIALGSQVIQKRGLGFYGKAFTLLLSAYFIADLVALSINSLLPETKQTFSRYQPNRDQSYQHIPFENYSIIISRNLFNSKGLLPGEDSSGTQDLGNAPVRTNLPFTLIGTVILKDELKSIATIEDKTASQVYPVRIQDEIPEKAKIISIEPRRVIFLNTSNGRREFLDLPEDNETNPRITLNPRASGGVQIEKTSSNQFSVPRSEIEKSLANLNQVLTQARAVPHYENGVSAGWKIFQIVPGSIYDKLGLQNGDLICGINGQSINDAGKAFEMLSELKTAKNLDLCIKRDGRQTNYAYEIN